MCVKRFIWADSHWYRGYVMEDPVVLAILGVIAVIIMATILRTIVNKILARRQNTRKSCSWMYICSITLLRQKFGKKY